MLNAPLSAYQIARRTISEVVNDRAMLIAAGVTYYILLASFPALAVLVTLYGLIADPADLGGQIHFLSTVLPPGALDMVEGQLKTLASQETSTLSIAFVVGFLIALWSANSGMKALFDAINVAYGESETRSFVRLNLISFAFTIGGVLVAILLIVAVGVVPAVLAFLSLDGWTETLARIAPWPVLLAIVTGGMIMLYRFGPSRPRGKAADVMQGAILATVVWMIASVAFSYYLANFADYNATYGTLGALIGFLVWIWLSVTIVIVGAELNAVLEDAREGKDKKAKSANRTEPAPAAA